MKALFKKRVLIPVVAVLLLVTTSAFKNDFFEIAKQIEIFTTLFKELNMNYVDETNPGELMDTAIKSMLKDLDPYTQFHNEQDVESYKINNSGEYTGIGASINRKDGRLFILEPFKDYPADKAGLKAGDEIIQIGDIKVIDSKDDTATLLKGAANSKITIHYIRQGEKKQTVLTRAAIDVDAVPFYKLINEKTGYVVLRKFNSKAYAQTKAAIVKLKAEGATQLILDLRGNPGGLLRESIRIVNLFVPKGEVIVTTKSKVKKYNKVYKTKNKPLDTEIPLVVLVNGSSASASEIVSGALQDLDRAVIVGSRSFGKGLVQRPKKLSYGTQLKVTISRYYTPSGRCIQALDYRNRDKKGNAIRTDEKNYTAFKTKKGRTVYDGGGVDPDIKIAKSKLSNISKALIREQVIFNFCTDYYYKNPIATITDFLFSNTDYENFKQYVATSGFKYQTNTEKILSTLEKQAVKDDIPLDAEIIQLKNSIAAAKTAALTKNQEELTKLITDKLVTRYFYKEGLYNYQITHHEDIKKGIEILNSGQYKTILK
ncbi:MAG: S41 family peptidase [Flavobacteriaceae bacterium]|nr:S41 family peptidase [Flavobacteriaceae bacterium]